MATQGLAAKGTLLKMGDGASPEVFTTIAEVTGIEVGKMSAKMLDMTNHSSEDGWAEKLPGILEAGQVSFDINFIPTATTHGLSAGLLKMLQNRTLKNYRVTFPDSPATSWTFAGYVAEFHPSAPVDGKLSAKVTIELTGKPTLA